MTPSLLARIELAVLLRGRQDDEAVARIRALAALYPEAFAALSPRLRARAPAELRARKSGRAGPLFGGTRRRRPPPVAT